MQCCKPKNRHNLKECTLSCLVINHLFRFMSTSVIEIFVYNVIGTAGIYSRNHATVLGILINMKFKLVTKHKHNRELRYDLSFCVFIEKDRSNISDH